MFYLLRKFKNIPFKFKQLLCSFGAGRKSDFFIIGAQKAGTTSLYKYIEEYADNFTPPKNKELNFFSEKFYKGLAWYKACFPIRNNKITGEATPDYLFFHKAPERVYNYNPNAKIIVLLRNPIERAYSQYNFQRNSDKTKAFNPLSFDEAIEQELVNEQKEDEFTYFYKYRSYVRRGKYYEQLVRWLEYFPKEQLLILESDDFYNNTPKKIKEVFNFLGLTFKNNKGLNFTPQNKTNYTEPLNENTRERLRKYYEPHNKKLYNLLDEEYNWK